MSIGSDCVFIVTVQKYTCYRLRENEAWEGVRIKALDSGILLIDE